MPAKATSAASPMAFPSTACLLQDRLGLFCGAFDVQAACAGFMYAMAIGAQFVRSGNSQLCLVVGGDTNSRIINPSDLKTYPLFAAAQKGAWLIGSEADVYQRDFGGAGAEADRVLTSVYFDPGAAVTAALKAYENGTPWNGSRPFSAADNAVTLAPFRVSEDVLSQLDRSDIAAVLALLADGSLETGIDPLTGNEL